MPVPEVVMVSEPVADVMNPLDFPPYEQELMLLPLMTLYLHCSHSQWPYDWMSEEASLLKSHWEHRYMSRDIALSENSSPGAVWDPH